MTFHFLNLHVHDRQIYFSSHLSHDHPPVHILDLGHAHGHGRAPCLSPCPHFVVLAPHSCCGCKSGVWLHQHVLGHSFFGVERRQGVCHLLFPDSLLESARQLQRGYPPPWWDHNFARASTYVDPNPNNGCVEHNMLSQAKMLEGGPCPQPPLQNVTDTWKGHLGKFKTLLLNLCLNM